MPAGIQAQHPFISFKNSTRQSPDMHPLAELDHAHVWHPFTQMRDWLSREPIVLVKGRRTTLVDVHGKRYLDANSSIWTNLHGHQHPRMNQAIRRQLGKVAHTSALGLANEPASQLAGELIQMARPPAGQSIRSDQRLQKVFFSDNGSTAIETALKLAYEFTRRTRGSKAKPRFMSLQGSYHGDTIGAVSLGRIDLFHQAYRDLLFSTRSVMAPYCYRCPFNRAKPERADARTYRNCNWECVLQVEKKMTSASRNGRPITAFIFEPAMQGAAGMIPQPADWLRRVSELAHGHGALLIADEVLTGMGRAGVGVDAAAPLLASHLEGVQPDLVALAKGLTGGYLPLAATLTTLPIFNAFLGEYDDFKTFFHGHSYTANQLGSAAAVASLELLKTEHGPRVRQQLESALESALRPLWEIPEVGDIRQVGLMVGIELVQDWTQRTPFALNDQAGIRVVEAMAQRGVLTRSIGNVVVLMPPYCTTQTELKRMVAAFAESASDVFKTKRRPKSGRLLK